jgi:hypothetical protein
LLGYAHELWRMRRERRRDHVVVIGMEAPLPEG